MDRTVTVPAGQSIGIYAQHGFPESLFMVNESATDTIYLTDTNGTAPGIGTPLGPGNVGTWAARRNLYASVAPGGAAATLALSDAMDSMFPAGAVASQLITQGLANDIAVANNQLGIPPTNTFDVLSTFTQSPWNGAPVFVQCNVNKYNTVEVNMTMTTTVNIGTPTLQRARFLWYTDNNGAPGTLLWSDDYYFTDNAANSGPSSPVYAGTGVITPIRGAWLKIIFSRVFVGGGTLVLAGNIIGRYSTLARPMASMTNAQTGVSGGTISTGNNSDNAWWITVAKSAAGILSDFAYCQNGRALFTVRNAANVVTLPLEVSLIDIQDNKVFASLVIPVGNTNLPQMQEILLPSRMMGINFGPATSACSSVTAALSFEPI